MILPSWLRVPLWGLALALAGVLAACWLFDRSLGLADATLQAETSDFLATAKGWHQRDAARTAHVAQLETEIAGHTARRRAIAQAAPGRIQTAHQIAAAAPDTCAAVVDQLEGQVQLAVGDVLAVQAEADSAEAKRVRQVDSLEAGQQEARDRALVAEVLLARWQRAARPTRLALAAQVASPLDSIGVVAEVLLAATVRLPIVGRVTLAGGREQALTPGGRGRWKVEAGKEWRLF